MITYSFGLPIQRKCGDLSLADVGLVGEGGSHGIRRSGGSETIFWVMQIRRKTLSFCATVYRG